MTDRPRVENAPGIVWRRKGDGWEAMWRARADLVKAGFRPKNQLLWSGLEPSPVEAAAMSDTCRRLQDEMLLFGRGGLPQVSGYDGTVRSLLNCYQTDPDSTYHKKRYAVRKNHDITYRRIMDRHGTQEVRDINARLLLVWHKEWSDGGIKIAMAHAFIGHLRTLFSFGATLLEDPECERLCGVLHKMRFQAPKPRVVHLTAEQATAVRHTARVTYPWPSIALAQALQFEGTLRQKDVIGEWVPTSEPGISDVVYHGFKWLRGLRWSEIDENFILRHNTSKKEKDIEIDLKLAPMVIEEFADYAGVPIAMLTRDKLPAKGPVVVADHSGIPWSTAEFRRKWRIVATKAGIPKNVRNMDSRAGAISEAISSGVPLEHVRHAATHSDIAMTQKYDRAAAEATAKAMTTRVAHRNKPKT